MAHHINIIFWVEPIWQFEHTEEWIKTAHFKSAGAFHNSMFKKSYNFSHLDLVIINCKQNNQNL